MFKSQKFTINNISEKAMVFRIFLGKVSFTYDGVFQLKLTVNASSSTDKGGVRLRTKNSNKFINDYSVRTEIVNFLKKQKFYIFESGEYSFYLPKAFFKTDINFYVYLSIDVIQISFDGKGKVTGSLKIPIYPRSDVNVNNNIEIGDPFYQFTGNVKLLSQSDNIGTNTYNGELFYQSEICEIREIPKNNQLVIEQDQSSPPINKPVTEKPKSDQPTPPVNKPVKEISKSKPKKIIEVSSIPFEKAPIKTNSNKKNLGSIKKKIIEFGVSPIPFSSSPIPPETVFHPRDINQAANIYNLLSPKNKEEISVFVRSGEHLFGSNQKPTKLYVSCSFKRFDNTREIVYDSTHVTTEDTTLPYWEEILNLSYENDKLETTLSLKVIDQITEKTIAEYILPIQTLTPFVQHHLKLFQKSTVEDIESVLFVTIIRKLDHFPLTGRDIKYSALIVKPLKFLYERNESANVSLTCFCYLCNDPTNIRKKINSIEENIIDMQFPSPSNFDYSNLKKPPMMSSGQLSIPTSIINGVDVFNFPFVFCQKAELDTSFTPHSFIVFDFYETSPTDGMNWRFNSPVMRTILELDKSLYWQLSSLESACINYYDVQINETSENDGTIKLKKSKDGFDQKLIIKLLLTNQNKTDSIVSDIIPQRKIQTPPVEVLPQPTQTVTKKVKEYPKEPPKEPPREPFLYNINPVKDTFYTDRFNAQNNLPKETEIDEMITRLIEDANREAAPIERRNTKSSSQIDQFRESLKKMQLEMVNLRNQIKKIQMENQKLELQMGTKQSNTNMSENEIKYLENLSTKDLFNEYDKLRRKFVAQVTEETNNKEREGNLIQTLGQRNSEESTSELLEKLQSQSKYLRKLEHDVLERESHISNLEAILDGKISDNEMREKKEKIKMSRKIESDENERSELYHQLQRAENRIQSLQNELAEIARKRGSNRQMMKIKEKEKFYR